MYTETIFRPPASRDVGTKLRVLGLQFCPPGLETFSLHYLLLRPRAGIYLPRADSFSQSHSFLVNLGSSLPRGFSSHFLGSKPSALASLFLCLDPSLPLVITRASWRSRCSGLPLIEALTLSSPCSGEKDVVLEAPNPSLQSVAFIGVILLPSLS